MIRLTGLAACTLGLVACNHMSVDSEQPAVISNPTDASRAALQSAVNEAMHTEVLLAEDALTDSSVLIIERRKTQSIDGMPADGRTSASSAPPARQPIPATTRILWVSPATNRSSTTSVAPNSPAAT